MVFSFFKKEPKKMVARPAAVPRAKEVPNEGPESGVTKTDASAGTAEASAAPDRVSDGTSTLDGSSFVFSESSLDFQIEADIDPVDAEAEEAAILFANGQDDAVRALLENAVLLHNSGPGERLWLMLFDFYQVTGHKAPFEALEMDYARAFAKSPPGWRGRDRPKLAEAISGSMHFRGELTGANQAGFDGLAQALEKNSRLRVDLSHLRILDATGCGRLLNLVHQARKARREMELLGRDTLKTLLEARVQPGRADDQECWLLLLELYQLQGQHEAFEDGAINYAVTFEVSPPSWEAHRVAAPEAVRALAAEQPVADLPVGAYVLRGDIKALRFGDLPARTEANDPVLIDCADLNRIDFISAGALLNVLTTVRRAGKQIVFRHPNHLVAELFGVVGLKAVATILLAKR